MAPKGSKTKTLTVQEKIEICRRLESGACPYNLANEYQVSVFTCRRIRREATTLQHYAEQGRHVLNRKNRRKPKYEAIEKRLYEWFLERKAAGDCLLTNSMFQKKALEIKKELGGYSDFNVSRGWVTKFRDRHNIRSLRLLDDNDTSTDEESVETLNLWPIEFLNNITETVEEDATKNHDNDDADEMIVTWKVVPSKKLKIEKCESPAIQDQLEDSIELPKYEETPMTIEEHGEEQIQLKHKGTRIPMREQEEMQIQPKYKESHIPMEEQEVQIQPKHKEICTPIEEQEEVQVQSNDKEIYIPMEVQEEVQIHPTQEEIHTPVKEQEEEEEVQVQLKQEEIDIPIEEEEQNRQEQQQKQEQGIVKEENEGEEESAKGIKMKELQEALKIMEKYARDRTTLTFAQCIINEILQEDT